MPEPVQLSPTEMSQMHAACFPHRPWKPNAFVGLMQQQGVFWGVDHEKRGFVMARKAATEAEILTLVVAPEHRRQGVARDLVINVLQACPAMQTERLFLEVAEDNHAAKGLYEGLGFIEVGRRKGYYIRGEAPPVDAVVMGRAITLSHLA
jgi:ribosomal-protein-alanine N-acetyltransferase